MAEELKKVQNYIIGQQLGKGTYAKVYLVTDENTNQKYAMKVIKRYSLSKSALERLQREIAIMQALKHPNTVHLHNMLYNSTRFMLVMDYIPSGELLQSIRAPLPEPLAAKYIIYVAATVRYFHALGISHRDLKFENVLLGEGGKLFVSDFGLGAVSNSPDKTFFTCKTTCGSPHYIAPEVADRERYDGKKADIWSLGVMFYTMLAFKFPFAGNDVREIFDNARKCSFEKLDCSVEAWELITGILQCDPDYRFDWTSIFASAFFKKYAEIGYYAVKIAGFEVPYLPTSEKADELKTLHKMLNIEQPKANQCPFCDAEAPIPYKNDVAAFRVKKAFALPKVTGAKYALSVVCAGLRSLGPGQIEVFVHYFLIKFADYGVEVRVFEPSPGKLYGSLGCSDPAVYLKFNYGLLKAIGAGVGFSGVEDVSVVCE